MNLRVLSVFSVIAYALNGCPMALADSTVDLAKKILRHEFSVLKSDGDTGIRGEIERCYSRIREKSGLKDIRYCYLLDYTSNEIDESVRKQLGMSTDPSGFHGDDHALERVVHALVRVGASKEESVIMIGQWTKAAMIANNN